MSAGRRLVTAGAVCLSDLLGGLGARLLVDGLEQPHPAVLGSVSDGGHASSAANPRRRAPSPRPPHTGRRGVSKGVPDRVTGPILRPSRPVVLRIPRLAVSSPLVQLRLD